VLKTVGPLVSHQGLLETVLCVQGAAPGALDGYLGRILPVMEADLFGDIAEAKEADAFAAKYRCVAFAKAFHCTWSASHVLQVAMKQMICPPF
jgi:hypothetical protein